MIVWWPPVITTVDQYEQNPVSIMDVIRSIDFTPAPAKNLTTALLLIILLILFPDAGSFISFPSVSQDGAILYMITTTIIKIKPQIVSITYS